MATVFEVTEVRNLHRRADVVERVRRGEPPERIRAGAVLNEGETLTAGVGVTAQVAVRGGVAQGQFVRLDEQTSFEVVSADADAPRIKVHKGRLWFSSALSVQRLNIECAEGRATILPLGTEYALTVPDADRGQDFSLLMIDGEARVSVPGKQDWLGPMWEGTWDAAAGQWRSQRLHPTDATAAMQAVNQRLQWALYYPAVLDLSELPERLEDDPALAESVAAYRRGNLLAALRIHPRPASVDRGGEPGASGSAERARGEGPLRAPGSESERLYQAALWLSVGRAEAVEEMLGAPPGMTDSGPTVHARVAQALRVVRAAVLGQDFERPWEPGLASEWLAESYYQQSQVNRRSPSREAAWEQARYRGRRTGLERALVAAQQARAVRGGAFSFAAVRVAELEFSFGATRKAEAAIDPALRAGPENAQAWALKGFLLSARNRIRMATNTLDALTLMDPGKLDNAMDAFNRAIALDPWLGNGWLGRGLCYFREGEVRAGVRDLERAVAAEPNRSFLRSYVGKAYDEAARELGRFWSGEARELRRELTPPEGQGRTEWLEAKAADRLGVAERLDPGDPTSLLYSALAKQNQNRINEAITDLERSKELNDNRMLYRSQALLDQDQSVRSANLAAIYRDAGMGDVSVREAANAVADDYANYAAHLFLANSFNELRDPNLVGLRYESATSAEYLLANLLAPVGGTRLSPYVTQQEYARLFERERLGLSSQTTYLSSGDWVQQASQYGWLKDTAYAVDVYYRTQNGVRVNNDLEQRAVSMQVKQQVTPQDSVYVQAVFSDSVGGDVRQYYDPQAADPNLRVTESQTPNLYAGYHHEWSPQMHTLLLVGRLQDRLALSTAVVTIPGVVRDDSGEVIARVEGFGDETFDYLDFHGEFEAYSAELQHIAKLSPHTLIGGVRCQVGETETSAEETRLDGAHFPPYASLRDFVSSQAHTTELIRLSVYGYDQWQILEPLWLTAGVSYDVLHYPRNVDLPPISSEERTSSQVSPKAGLVWTPAANTTCRGAFTRSLGGLFYDASVRLEPVQVAGFNQAYRGLIPESVEGAIPGTRFQTFDLGVEQKFKSRTFLVLQLERLESEAGRDVGAFDYYDEKDATPSQLYQELTYEERSLALSLSQLAGRDWALGARYRVSEADLKTRYPGLSQTLFPDTHHTAILNALDFHAIFNHPRGWFAQAQALWRQQTNDYYDPPLPGDDFWQFNLYAGYRFPRRQAEVIVGLLNLTDQDYHLNPLNLYPELPRDRTFLLSFRFNL